MLSKVYHFDANKVYIVHVFWAITSFDQLGLINDILISRWLEIPAHSNEA